MMILWSEKEYFAPLGNTTGEIKIFSFLFSEMNHYIYVREFFFPFFLNKLNSMIQIDYITCDIWVHSPPLLPSRAQTKGCLCVCVYVCNIHLIFFLCYYFSAPNFLRLPSPVCPPSYTLIPKNPLLYDDILNYPRPLSFRPSVISVPFFPIFSHARARVVASLLHPSSLVAAECAPKLSLGLRRSRLFDLTIASDILARTKPHISEYSRFSL